MRSANPRQFQRFLSHILPWVAAALLLGPSSAVAADPELKFRYGWELELTPPQYSLLMDEVDMDYFAENYPYDTLEESPAFDQMLDEYLTHSRGLEAIKKVDPALYARLAKDYALEEDLLLQPERAKVEVPRVPELPPEFAPRGPVPALGGPGSGSSSSGLYRGSGVLLPNGRPASEANARPSLIVPGSSTSGPVAGESSAAAAAREVEASAGKLTTTEKGLVMSMRTKRQGLQDWWAALPRTEKMRFFDVRYLSRDARAQLVKETYSFKSEIPYWRWKDSAPDWLKKLRPMHDGKNIVEFTIDPNLPIHDRAEAVDLLRNLSKRTGTYRQLFEVDSLERRGTIPLHWHTSVEGYPDSRGVGEVAERMKLLEGIEDVDRWNSWEIMRPASDPTRRGENYVDHPLYSKGNLRLVDSTRIEERELALSPDAVSRRTTEWLSMPPEEAIRDIDARIGKLMTPQRQMQLLEVNPALWARYLPTLPPEALRVAFANPAFEALPRSSRLTVLGALLASDATDAEVEARFLSELREMPTEEFSIWVSNSLRRRDGKAFASNAAFEVLQSRIGEMPEAARESALQALAALEPAPFRGDADRIWFQTEIWELSKTRPMLLFDPPLRDWLRANPIRHGAVEMEILSNALEFRSRDWLEFLSDDPLVMKDAFDVLASKGYSKLAGGVPIEDWILARKPVPPEVEAEVARIRAAARASGSREVLSRLDRFEGSLKAVRGFEGISAKASSREAAAHGMVEELLSRKYLTANDFSGDRKTALLMDRLADYRDVISAEDRLKIAREMFERSRLDGYFRFHEWVRDLAGSDPEFMKAILDMPLSSATAEESRIHFLREDLLKTWRTERVSDETFEEISRWVRQKGDAGLTADLEKAWARRESDRCLRGSLGRLRTLADLPR